MHTVKAYLGVEVYLHSFLTLVSGQLHTPASVHLGKEPPVPIQWYPEPLWIHWSAEMPLTHTGNLSTISWLSNTYPSQLTDLFISVYHIVGPLAACVAPCELFLVAFKTFKTVHEYGL